MASEEEDEEWKNICDTIIDYVTNHYLDVDLLAYYLRVSNACEVGIGKQCTQIIKTFQTILYVCCFELNDLTFFNIIFF